MIKMCVLIKILNIIINDKVVNGTCIRDYYVNNKTKYKAHVPYSTVVS